MGKPRATEFTGNVEELLANEHMNWLKMPSYGMSDELNILYHKTKMKQSLLNSDTDNDKQNVLNVIQQIASDTNITFVNKLHLINELIEVNKDYFDSYDTIINDAIVL